MVSFIALLIAICLKYPSSLLKLLFQNKYRADAGLIDQWRALLKVHP
jgi:hypothetical protein